MEIFSNPAFPVCWGYTGIFFLCWEPNIIL